MLLPDSAKLARQLSLCILCLITFSTATQIFASVTGHNHMFGLVRFFYLDAEANLPTWYSGATLLLSAGLAWIIGVAERTGGSDARYWFGLAAIFTLLSADEVAGLHELLIGPLRTTLGVGGYLYFAWVIPAAVVLILLTVAYMAWFLRLPRSVKRMSLLAAVLYVGGGMGVEMIGANEASLNGVTSLYYIAIVTVEEALEMAGVAAWLVTMLRYAEIRGYNFKLHFASVGTNSPVDRS